MKVKTSITLSEDILQKIDSIIKESGNRSEFIEQAIRNYIQQRIREHREKQDLEILNRYASRLNKESKDVLSYQVEL